MALQSRRNTTPSCAFQEVCRPLLLLTLRTTMLLPAAKARLSLSAPHATPYTCSHVAQPALLNLHAEPALLKSWKGRG